MKSISSIICILSIAILLVLVFVDTTSGQTVEAVQRFLQLKNKVYDGEATLEEMEELEDLIDPLGNDFEAAHSRTLKIKDKLVDLAAARGVEVCEGKVWSFEELTKDLCADPKMQFIRESVTLYSLEKEVNMPVEEFKQLWAITMERNSLRAACEAASLQDFKDIGDYLRLIITSNKLNLALALALSKEAEVHDHYRNDNMA